MLGAAQLQNGEVNCADLQSEVMEQWTIKMHCGG